MKKLIIGVAAATALALSATVMAAPPPPSLNGTGASYAYTTGKRTCAAHSLTIWSRWLKVSATVKAVSTRWAWNQVKYAAPGSQRRHNERWYREGCRDGLLSRR
jgi:hypothetical protein